ncbi:3-deoxy-D-manno-octulosonic acid transferase [Marixanthomonas ophiurae]|nr:glycosyltransferase N-terminal domain-containing protein [Marixanthomonas ophiurae]
MKLFVSGRTQVFENLAQHITSKDKTIWFHCASLGEFEQGVPIMKAVKREFPNHKIVVSFFSPSGYEVKKSTPVADVVIYLPLDTISNAKKFINVVHPSLVLFVKYEFWPNYLFELKNRNIPTLLISGLFREGQVFFKGHGSFMRKALKSFDHIFVQDKTSEALLHSINITNVTVSGDTRFDRVSHQIEHDNSLSFISAFKENSLCIVCGSTWPEDEAVLLKYINEASEDVKFIIAPHNIDTSKIEHFRKKLKGSSVKYSEKEGKKLADYSVFIIDTIGLLTKIYSYADIAYVGGAMGKTGLHNILEPATFGVPIVIGKNFENFPEAKRLQQLAGLYAVDSAAECTEILNKLVTNSSFREKTGMIAEHFVNSNTGATNITLNYITKLNRNGLI